MSSSTVTAGGGAEGGSEGRAGGTGSGGVVIGNDRRTTWTREALAGPRHRTAPAAGTAEIGGQRDDRPGRER